jgi:hypothetical protein
VRAQLAIASDQSYIQQTEYERLHGLARRVSGMLSNFIAHLQTSGYRGEKFARPGRLAARDTWLQDFCAKHGIKLPDFGQNAAETE